MAGVPAPVSRWLTRDLLCVALTRRTINNNHFTGALPSTIGNMKSLQNLIIENNMFSGPLPTSLCAMGNLQTLVLNNCAFSGPLPSCMAKLNIWELHMSNNRFTGSLAVVGQMQQLQNLYVAEVIGMRGLCARARMNACAGLTE